MKKWKPLSTYWLYLIRQKTFLSVLIFFLLKQCYAGDVTWHFTFTSLPFLGRVFVGFFGVFFFFANAQNFAVLIKTRYFCRISSLANSLSVHEQNPLDLCNQSVVRPVIVCGTNTSQQTQYPAGSDEKLSILLPSQCLLCWRLVAIKFKHQWHRAPLFD